MALDASDCFEAAWGGWGLSLPPEAAVTPKRYPGTVRGGDIAGNASKSRGQSQLSSVNVFHIGEGNGGIVIAGIFEVEGIAR